MAPTLNGNPKPSLVIVPGSFSPAYFYDKTVNKLREHGYEVIVDGLPSASRSPPEPAATVEEDAAHFHDIFERLADEGKDVVVVTHSYGGIPGTQGTRGLSKPERAASNKQGGVVRIVYLTSVVPKEGQSLVDLTGGQLKGFFKFHGDYMEQEVEHSGPIIFSYLPVEEAKEWTRKMPLHSRPSFEGKLTYAGYKHIPVSYIFCEDDQVLPPEFQKNCIETIEQESGNKVTVHNFKSDHCPNASAPEATADVILSAALLA